MKKLKKRIPVQNKFHVKKGDEVVVIAGNFKPENGNTQRGKVLQVLPKKNRVIIEGINMIKKAMRKTADNPQGGITEREGTLHISNVMLAEKYDKKHGTSPKAEKSAAKKTSKAAKAAKSDKE